MRKRFAFYLVFISLLGFLLRLTDYDRIPPWNESLDELHYAWTGLTWIKEGVPRSWSYLESFKEAQTRRLWDTEFRLVSPMLEKPPLYSLLSGGVVVLFNEKSLEEVRITTVRLLPLALSVVTILLTGLVGQQTFSPPIGLLATLLYATTAPIVLANRLSVTENLLTPLILGLQVLFFYLYGIFKNKETPRHTVSGRMPSPGVERTAIIIGILSGLAALTKQIGIVTIIVSGGLLGYLRRWRLTLIVVAVGFLIFSIYPLTGTLYDWQLFRSIQSELRRIGLQGGLPQLLQTMVSRPLVTTERQFPDGTILLGYFLFFSSPWWLPLQNIKKVSLKNVFPNSFRDPRLFSKDNRILKHIQDDSTLIFLAFPFAYLTYLTLIITGAEPIGSGQAYWGWYAYPLFPYLTILVASVLVGLWQRFSLWQGLLVTLILGSSAVRYVLLTLPRQHHYRWQHVLVGLVALVAGISLIPHKRYTKIVQFIILALFIGVNIYTVLSLNRLYPGLEQPLE